MLFRGDRHSELVGRERASVGGQADLDPDCRLPRTGAWIHRVRFAPVLGKWVLDAMGTMSRRSHRERSGEKEALSRRARLQRGQ